MTKFTLLAIAMTFSLAGITQSRTSQSSIQFTDSTEILLEATGWAENTVTGWHANTNAIDSKDLHESMRSHVPNFNQLQFFRFDHDRKTYVALFFEYETGKYKYPNIYKDWEEFKSTMWFVLPEKQFNELKKTVESLDGTTQEYVSKLCGEHNSEYAILGGSNAYSNEIFMSKITNLMESQGTTTFEYSPEYSILINAQINEGEKVVRFKLPKKKSSYGDSLDYAYFEVALEVFMATLTFKE
jgi:hypothetical protein